MNQGGVNFIIFGKQMIGEGKQINNSSFLISPTTNLFPLSGQSGNHGVSITITLKYKNMEYEIYNEINYTTL